MQLFNSPFIPFSFVLLFISLFSSAQEGWKQSSDQEGWMYTPNDLKPGKKFYYKAYTAESVPIKEIEEWLLVKAKEYQSILGKPLEPWKVKVDKKGQHSISNSYKDTSGIKFSVGYQAEKLESEKYFIMQMVTTQDLGMIVRYGMAYQKVRKNAATRVNFLPKSPPTAKTDNKPETTENPHQLASFKEQQKVSIQQLSKMRTKERGKAIAAAIRIKAGKGVNSSEIEALWVDKYIDVMVGGIRVDTYLLLKNGDAYKGCEIPPSALNVAESKRLEGKSPWRKYSKWTAWRKNSSGRYEVKKNKTGEWEVLDGVKAKPGIRGEILNNTFWSFSGSSNFGSHKSSIKLMSNSRFELSSNSIMGGDMGGTEPHITTASKSNKEGTSTSTAVVGTRVGGGNSSHKDDGKKNTGSYKIMGHIIEFRHDNGYTRRELFFFVKDKNSIVIGDENYWVKAD